MTDAAKLHCLERYAAYAAAFESAFDSDDWSALAPHFTADASAELNGMPVTGREAVLATFRTNVTMFDRRFDVRRMRLVVGPEWDSAGRLHTKTGGRYERAALPPLEVHGEEWFTFDGDRIRHHVDQVTNLSDVMAYLAEHAAGLRPLPG